MKFYCEYCRSQIDAEKDKKCPSCKASYKDNKEYRKLLEEKENHEQEIKEHQQYIQKQVLKAGKTAGIFVLIVPILAFVIMGTIIFIGIKEAKKNNNKVDDIFNEVEEKINKTDKKVEKEVENDPIIINQEKSSDDYKITFENYKLIDQTKDKEFNKLEVTLVVEKISDKFSAWGEEVYCLVNNVSQEKDRFNSDNSTYIKDKNIPTSKKITFYIPKGTKSFDIKYGNEVDFHIDM